MLLPGLVSITFRKLDPAEIIDLSVRGGLSGIEWGGDVHVPHGDLRRAREVREMTVDAGLAVASYGSYYRVGEEQDFTFDQALASAVELCAPTIRVWAGGKGSAASSASHLSNVADESREIATRAAEAGVIVAYEFHRNTLTDTTQACLDLLHTVAHPNVRTYWQPPRELTDEELGASLGAVLPFLANLHVFQWAEDGARCPLAEGRARWQRLCRQVQGHADDVKTRYAMLEFVKDDAPEQFLHDAAALCSLLGEL